MGPHNPSILVPHFDVIESTVTVATSATVLVGANPNRISIIFSRFGTPAVGYSTLRLTSAGGGIVSDGISNNVFLTFRDYGSLVTFPWFAIATLAGSTVHIIETIFRPER